MSEFDRFRLDDRVALVPGGSGGIGVRLCTGFAGVGARVAIVGRHADALDDARQAIEAAGGDVVALMGDMTNETDAERVVGETLDAFGRLDVLVNAIGGGAGAALHAAHEYPED